MAFLRWLIVGRDTSVIESAHPEIANLPDISVARKIERDQINRQIEKIGRRPEYFLLNSFALLKQKNPWPGKNAEPEVVHGRLKKLQK